jgi:UPF0755 protein
MNMNSLRRYWSNCVLPLTKRFFNDVYVRYFLTGLVILALALYAVNRAPDEFPVQMMISVKAGESLADISRSLKEAHVIRSQLLFESVAILQGGERHMIAGDYFFTKPLGTAAVVGRLTSGEYGLTPVRITIPEGTTVSGIASLLKNSFWNFDTDTFIKQAQDKEGYLFPDTYFFLPTMTPQEVISILNETFEKKIKTIDEEIIAFGKPLRDVIIMASLIEKEAAAPEDRRIISGILWKRIAIGMPLQVDAAFIYVNGETTKDLSTADLKIDSPYNTYRYKGLPPGPIGNPGLDAIFAAVSPQQSPYLYYLSDDKGIMHYAKTFEEHKQNKQKYL